MRFLYCLFILFSFTPLFAQDECAFDFHEFDANFKEQALANFVTKGVIPPFKHLEIPFKDFTFKPDRPKIFTLPSGTMIDVPKNAFRDKNGKVVEEKVVLYYREFNNSTDILLSGIPMNYKTPEGDMPMQSAGMFEIRASTTEGEELFVNENEPISVSVISTESEDDFNYYEMGDETGEWVEKGKDELDFDFEFNGNWNLAALQNRMPKLQLAHLNIRILSGRSRVKGHNKLQFKAGIYLSKKRKYEKEDGQSLSLAFTEMNAWQNLTWIYDGDKKNEGISKLKLEEIDKHQQRHSVSRQTWGEEELPDSLQLMDIKLTVNPEGDNYLFSFILKSEVFIIPVYPYFKTKSMKVEQKRNLKAFKEYFVDLEKRREKWERKKAFYESELILFNRKKKLLEQEGESQFDNILNTEIAKGKKRTLLSRRKTKIQSFGMCNIDRIKSGLDKEEILVNLEDRRGNVLKAEAIYVWDNTNKVLLSYFNNRIQLMKNSRENMVTILLKDNQIAVVNKDEFNESLKKQRGKKLRLIVDPIRDEGINRKQISQITAAL